MKSKINNMINKIKDIFKNIKISTLKDKIKTFKYNSLKVKVWLYLVVFSILILAFLWLFQIIFLNTFYEISKAKELKTGITEIKEHYTKDTLEDSLDDISIKNNICVQIVNQNTVVYDSSLFNKSCISNNEGTKYKLEFISSGKSEDTVKLINPRYNNDVLLGSIRLNDSVVAFVSISLQPLDSTIDILKNQMMIVTIVVLLLSFIIGYFISKKISSPIVKINKSAKKLALGNYDTVFNVDEDIEELNELINTLNTTANELSKTEELRRELMANVSHDLKTPLTMIKAYAEMVRDLTYKNKQKREENLNVIIEESDRLNLLVNDILELSSIQAKGIVLNYETFDIVELISSIIKRYSILIANEQYEFIFKYTDKVIVFADKKRIEQVIYNLINNAINYTGSDNKITVNLINKDKTVIIEIIDTGKGIDKKDIKLIWDKYYKVDKNHKRDMVGSGIGLSIVKNILINHNFEYGVNSIKNQGTTFWFEIEKDINK